MPWEQSICSLKAEQAHKFRHAHSIFFMVIAQTRLLLPSLSITPLRSLHASSAHSAQNTNDYRANREKFPEDDLSTRYTDGQGPSALDKASQSLLLTELVRGMWVVLESFFRPPYTLMYPFEKGALSPRFRGEHALRRYPSGMDMPPPPSRTHSMELQNYARCIPGADG